MKNYLITSDVNTNVYSWITTSDEGGFNSSYPIAGKGFSIVEIPGSTEPEPYMGCRYIGPPSSLLLTDTGYNPANFLDVLELPPGGLGEATWDGTQWVSTEGGVPTGGLLLGGSNVSDRVLSVFEGGSITVNCEHTCTNDPTASITYEWFNEGSLSLGTGSSFTFTNITNAFRGRYLCIVRANNGIDFGAKGIIFSLDVYPNIP